MNRFQRRSFLPFRLYLMWDNVINNVSAWCSGRSSFLDIFRKQKDSAFPPTFMWEIKTCRWANRLKGIKTSQSHVWPLRSLTDAQRWKNVAPDSSRTRARTQNRTLHTVLRNIKQLWRQDAFACYSRELLAPKKQKTKEVSSSKVFRVTDTRRNAWARLLQRTCPDSLSIITQFVWQVTRCPNRQYEGLDSTWTVLGLWCLTAMWQPCKAANHAWALVSGAAFTDSPARNKQPTKNGCKTRFAFAPFPWNIIRIPIYSTYWHVWILGEAPLIERC